MSGPESPPDDRGLIRAFSTVEGTTGDRAEALDPDTMDQIWRAVRGELPAPELVALLERVRQEPDLAEAWRVARAVSEELVDPAPDAVTVGATPEPETGQLVRGPASWWRVAAVGGALAAAALALFVVQAPAPAPPPEAGPMRAAETVLSSALDSAELDRSQPELAWSSAGPGATYSVTVTTDRLQPVARTGGLAETRWTLPAASVAPLPPGAVLLWRVEALLPDGSRHRSPTFEAVLP